MSCYSCFMLEADQVLKVHDPNTASCGKGFLRFWRILAAVLLTLVGGWVAYDFSGLFDIFKYLSYHGYYVTWMYFMMVTFDGCLNSISSDSDNKLSPNLKYLVQYLFELSVCLEVAIIAIYWSVLFKDNLGSPAHTLIRGILVHGLPIIFLIIDWINNAYSFKWTRLILTILYSIAYLGLNIAYTLRAEPIYSIIDWKGTTSVIYFVAAFVLVILTHVFGRVFYNCCKKEKTEQVISMEDMENLQKKRGQN